MNLEEELKIINDINHSDIDSEFSSKVIKAIEIIEKKDKSFKFVMTSCTIIALINIFSMMHFFENNIEKEIKSNRMQTLIAEFSLDK